MKKIRSVFFKTNSIYENCKILNIKEIKIDFPLAKSLIKLTVDMFRVLDRTDPEQSEFFRRLWVLRSTVIFTVLPFNNPALKLQEQMSELERLSECLPDTKMFVNALKKMVSEIVAHGENPKGEWLARMPRGEGHNAEFITGLFIGLSLGRPPGWPKEAHIYLEQLEPSLLPIRTKKNLRSNLFRTIVLPCACSNAPLPLLSGLFHSGLAANIEVLLYPGEIFRLPKRLTIPSDNFFSERLQKSKTEHEHIEVSVDQPPSEVDEWINDAFWQDLHGADRNSGKALEPARYLLFLDGTGTFIPYDASILTIPAAHMISNKSDLSMTKIDDISEGDIVVIRTGASGMLLEEASERILGRDENERLSILATDWKSALEALLVTHDSREVAAALLERGLSVKAASIQQWVGPDVLGPRSENILRELIYLLAEKGKIQKSGETLTSYAESSWQALQDLRGLHQKAGSLIRDDLFKALSSRFGTRCFSDTLPDRDSIRIDASDAQLLLLRVAALDMNVSYVPHSRIYRLDDLVNNKWLR